MPDMLGYLQSIGAGSVANCAGEGELLNDAQPNKKAIDIVVEKNKMFLAFIDIKIP